MAVELTPDELREVSLAIVAYKAALDKCDATGAAAETVRLLESARAKIAREWRLARNASVLHA